MHRRIVGEHHEELLTEKQIEQNEDRRKEKRVGPGEINHLLCSLLLTGTNVLADHRHCSVLDALRNLIDDIVDTHADAEGRRGHHADVVDHRVHEEHRQIDKARLDRHRCAETGDHTDILLVWDEIFEAEVEAESVSLLVEVIDREEEGNSLTDHGCPRRTCNAPSPHTGKEDIKNKVHGRSNTDEQKWPFRVTHATQNRRHEVISACKKQTCRTNHEVVHRHIVRFDGDLHRR